MSYPLLALFVVFSGLAAAAALCVALHQFLHRDTFRRCHELGSAVFIQFGVVFAVLLAFVFNDVWSDYQSTAEAINKECASLHGVAILSQSLPASSRDATLTALRTYLLTVIDREWPAMRRRSKSLEAQQRFQTLWQTAATATANPAQSQIMSQMLVLLDEAHENRETRVFQMTQSVPGLVWTMLALFAAGLVTCMLLFITEAPVSKAVFVGVFTSSLTLALLTVHILDSRSKTFCNSLLTISTTPSGTLISFSRRPRLAEAVFTAGRPTRRRIDHGPSSHSSLDPRGHFKFASPFLETIHKLHSLLSASVISRNETDFLRASGRAPP